MAAESTHGYKSLTDHSAIQDLNAPLTEAPVEILLQETRITPVPAKGTGITKAEDPHRSTCLCP